MVQLWVKVCTGVLGVCFILAIAAIADPSLNTNKDTHTVWTCTSRSHYHASSCTYHTITDLYGHGIFSKQRNGDLETIDCSDGSLSFDRAHKCNAMQAFSVIGIVANLAALLIGFKVSCSKTVGIKMAAAGIGGAASTSFSYLVVVSLASSPYGWINTLPGLSARHSSVSWSASCSALSRRAVSRTRL